MPPAAAPAAPDGAPAPAPANPLGGIFRMLFMWWVMREFMGGSAPKPATLPRDQVLMPRLPRGSPVDVVFALAEAPALVPGWAAGAGGAAVVWRTTAGLSTAAEAQHTVDYELSKTVQNNGTLYLHVVMAPSGSPLDAADAGFDPALVVSRAFPAVAFLPRPKSKAGVNLLSGDKAKQPALAKEEEEEEEEGQEYGGGAGLAKPKPPREIISFLKPNLTVAMVDDFSTYNAKAVPDHVLPHLDIDPATMTYAPTLWLNDFWLLRDKLVPLNETVSTITLHLSLYSLPPWKLMLYTQMEHSFSMQQSWGAMNDGESDEFKRVLTEGNPYFLGLTMLVSLMHSVFDALAFKNDIGFWKGKKDVAGLSVRTIGFNAGCQAVIFLYLLDNDTSFVVLASTGVGLLIELWKLTQAMDVTLAVVNGRPSLRLKDKASYTASRTDEHDAVAMKWLSLCLIPCVGGYALYSLAYDTHRSWYSWILSSLVGAVYMFGFVLMCPQLYLNYKLKSVAHLPWRQMTYKFLNTIIDDLFAFVIKMPTLHRLSVFRDDIVFAVYLYQRWVYRVDRSRANEFGFSAEGAAAGEGAAVLEPGAAAPAGALPAAAAPAGDARRRRGAAEPAAAAVPASASAGGKKDE